MARRSAGISGRDGVPFQGAISKKVYSRPFDVRGREHRPAPASLIEVKEAPPSRMPLRRLVSMRSAAWEGTIRTGRAPQRHELLKELDEQHVQAIMTKAKAARVGPGTLLIRQGDPPGELTLLTAGRVRVSRISDDGRQATIRLIGSNDLLGCAAVFGGGSHPASATTLEACDILSWTREHMLDLMNAYPRLALNALAIIGVQLAELTCRDATLSTEPVRQRLASQLLALAGAVGAEARTGSEIRMTRQELGELCGATFFTVSRILSAWARAGIVSPGRGWVRVIDHTRLSRIASGDRHPVRDRTRS